MPSFSVLVEAVDKNPNFLLLLDPTASVDPLLVNVNQPAVLTQALVAITSQQIKTLFDAGGLKFAPGVWTVTIEAKV